MEVLLATWNGERFLPPLLDSLLSQSFRDYTLTVSDDCSTDRTPEILAQYRDRFGSRLNILPPLGYRQGASSNFARLLDAATGDRIFFCDQDDVWLPEKMTMSLAAMRRLADRHPPGMPLLIHTDLKVVGADLEELGPSFYRYAGISPNRSDLGHLLLGNVATGCTMLVNRALYTRARPVPDVALMYDHWLMQVAAAIGATDFLDVPTVLYRQHGGNCVGAQKAGTASLSRRIARILLSDRTLQVLYSYSRHAEALLERYGEQASERHRRSMEALARVWTLPRARRFLQLTRAGLRKPGLAQSLGLFLLLLRDVRHLDEQARLAKPETVPLR